MDITHPKCCAGEWDFTLAPFVHSPASLGQYLQSAVSPVLDPAECTSPGSPAAAWFALTLGSFRIHFLPSSALAVEQLSLALGSCRVMAFSYTGLLQGRLPRALNSGSVQRPADSLVPRGQIFSKSHWRGTSATSSPSREPGFALSNGDWISILEKRVLLWVSYFSLKNTGCLFYLLLLCS